MDGIQQTRRAAEEYDTRRDFTEAKLRYDAATAACTQVAALEQQRQRAIAARATCEQARQMAMSAGGESDGSAAFREARDLASKAPSIFEHAQFDEARQAWSSASQKYEQARSSAQALSAARRGAAAAQKQSQEAEALARAAGATGEGSFTKAAKYALDAQTAVDAGDLTRAESLWQQASADYASAIESAKAAKEQAKRDQELSRQRQIAQLLATAKANDSKEKGKTALGALDMLLTIDPGNTEAAVLRARIEEYYKPQGVTLDLGKGVTMKFAPIPAGKFMMGSPASEAGRCDNEAQHEVTITKAFYIGVYLVTQEQYEAVMGENPSRFKGAKRPVEQVSWEDAMKFCQKVSEMTGRKVRLPTEAEWEYACRAGTRTAYYTGDKASDLADAGWYGGNSANATHPVGEKKPNAWGLYDMHGNVNQWCADWYDGDPQRSVIDPVGPINGVLRVCRGSCYMNGLDLCRAAVRRNVTPVGHFDFIGVRLSLDF